VSGDAPTDERLTKLTFNAIQPTMVALERVAAKNADTRTDTLNRAVQIYDAMLAVPPGGTLSFDGRTFVCVGGGHD
jgi:hypothetical protein